jgi:hypothetical protein
VRKTDTEFFRLERPRARVYTSVNVRGTESKDRRGAEKRHVGEILEKKGLDDRRTPTGRDVLRCA